MRQQQEAALLAAFRRMPVDVRNHFSVMADCIAMTCAKEDAMRKRSNLTLVVSDRKKQ